VGGGAWLFYRQQQLDPDALDDSIVSLARRSNAEVTVAQVVSELGVPDNAAHNALELLAHKGEVRRDWRDDRAVYMFPGLKESKVIRQCSHCGSQFSVAKHMSKCPNCGSTEIELVRT
jgi:predicted Zn-ribbon and HTH transcriptional regulator